MFLAISLFIWNLSTCSTILSDVLRMQSILAYTIDSFLDEGFAPNALFSYLVTTQENIFWVLWTYILLESLMWTWNLHICLCSYFYSNMSYVLPRVKCWRHHYRCSTFSKWIAWTHFGSYVNISLVQKGFLLTIAFFLSLLAVVSIFGVKGKWEFSVFY